ncbi:murein hydrolase activator EnvC family protein [Mucilaginibacter ximonensis]|uniref:Murein hydrolase activator EnvC family protein n=1 Tax=Mucilaginibacter ximonensis TaxID=538021 RepID=A0ABW5Y8W5_9SPHI
MLRGGPGAYGAPRGQGKTHSGVDIVANQSSMDKSTYSVYAVNSGTVAYAKMNGTSSTGYGYTIVIDHGDGNYSQYSHLATNASTGLVKLGDKVTAGQLIGYMADLRKNERSSGNVLAEVVKPYDKIQLHFECILNKTGLRSPTSLAIFHTGGFLTDPTKDLQNLSYKSF